MEHKMGLYEQPMGSIQSGRKTVEVRLNDDKRRKIQVGDTIQFTKVPSEDETLTVEVIGLREFPTFRDMYETIPAEDFDAVGDSISEMVESTYDIYSPEREREWGTLAITIKLLEK